MNQFDEIKYYSNIARLRYTIAGMKQQYHLIDKVVIDHAFGKINPYDGKITKNGAIGLEFSDGQAMYLFTPYGKVRIDSARVQHRDLTKQRNFFQDLNQTLGLVEVEPRTTHNGYYEYGPVFAITKLPWEPQSKLPAIYTKISRSPDQVMDEAMYRLMTHHDIDDMIDKETEPYITQVYDRVNRQFAQEGHPEFMIHDAAEELESLESVEEMPTTKKSNCLLSNFAHRQQLHDQERDRKI